MKSRVRARDSSTMRGWDFVLPVPSSQATEVNLLSPCSIGHLLCSKSRAGKAPQPHAASGEAALYGVAP
jgi:hypothetical protein